MNVFINDCLLQGELLDRHLQDVDSLFESLKTLSEFTQVIQNKKLEYGGALSINLILSKSLLTDFFTFINTKDIENFIVSKLSKSSPIYWDENSIQNHQKQYHFYDTTDTPPKNHYINNTSLAEAYEYLSSKNESVIALNFPDSILSMHRSLMVLATKTNPPSTGARNISCGDSKHLLEEWIEHNINISEFTYNTLSKDPPLDKQTCLRSKIRFTETTKFAGNGRKIYIENKTGFQWYVDNAHYGEKSHIEVFNNDGSKFIGEAKLEGVIIKKENPHNKTNAEKKKEKRIIRR